MLIDKGGSLWSQNYSMVDAEAGAAVAGARMQGLGFAWFGARLRVSWRQNQLVSLWILDMYLSLAYCA